MRDLGYYEETRTEGEVGMGSSAVSELACKTLYAWREAVSPHLAAERESGLLENSAVLELLQKCLRAELEGERKEMDVFCVVETAGGVASPGPSGSLQCDLYRYLILITCPNIKSHFFFFFGEPLALL
jgi:dethiobiotin synthetase/adenosylmethionine--8-amino-7-oxononanoate aminotransferase